jgi:hypothetical protein
MNVALHGRVTAQDVVRVEKVQEDVRELARKVDALQDRLNDLASSALDQARKCVATGAKKFAEDNDTPAAELEREIALARARLQCERWRGWWGEVERELADVEAAFAEFRVSQQLGLALDCCSE